MEDYTADPKVEDAAPNVSEPQTWEEAIAISDPVKQRGSGLSSIGKPLQSSNFVEGSKGWRLNSNGLIEAVGATFNGGSIKSGQTAYNTGTGFFLGDENGTAKFSIGNSTDNLTWDGTNLSFTGKTRATYKISTIFENSSRFLLYSNGITFDNTGIRIRPLSTIVANRYSTLQILISTGSVLDVITGTSFSADCHLVTIGAVTAGNDGGFYLGTNSGSINGTSMDLTTTKQYGFKALKVSGVVTLYATNSNGSSETTTSLGTITTSFYSVLSAVSTPTAIYFYQDNTLVATHTTNLPGVNTQNWCFDIGISNFNTAYDFDFNVNSANFEKFSGLS